MHENTLMNISGRVDFLDMPILDKIENKTEHWFQKEIETVKTSNNVQDKISKL